MMNEGEEYVDKEDDPSKPTRDEILISSVTAAAFDEGDLCCCEYINSKGERSHLLGICCDCEALDDSFERLILRQDIPQSRIHELCSTIQDRFRVPWCGGARRINLLTVAPLLILPFLGYLSTFGPFCTIISFLIMPIFLRLVSKYIGNKRSTFHFSFSVSSLFYSFIVLYFYAFSESSWVLSLCNWLLFFSTFVGIMLTKRKGRRDAFLVMDPDVPG